MPDSTAEVSTACASVTACLHMFVPMHFVFARQSRKAAKFTILVVCTQASFSATLRFVCTSGATTVAHTCL